MQENGPMVFPDFNNTITPNEFSWNTYANMLYIEAPAGVGFSFFIDQNDLTTNDV
jgi:carboxypeptidase C (cathepsin A)